MHLPSIALAATCIGLAASRALPETHVVHERRSTIDTGRWIKRDRVAGHLRVPVRVGLKQRNLHKAEDWLLEVSHPFSSKYGQHWTPEEVVDAFQPAKESVDAVLDWITSVSGIEKHKITHTDNKAWLAFDASIDDMEKLVNAEFHEHHHESSGRAMISCGMFMWSES